MKQVCYICGNKLHKEKKVVCSWKCYVSWFRLQVCKKNKIKKKKAKW